MKQVNACRTNNRREQYSAQRIFGEASSDALDGTKTKLRIVMAVIRYENPDDYDAVRELNLRPSREKLKHSLLTACGTTEP